MENMNPDQARTIRDFLLPTIEAEHKVTRMLLQAVPSEALDFKPDPGGKTLSELMWYLVLAEHHSLTGICDAQFAAPPQKPDQRGADAVLAWDDQHFPKACQRLAQLSGDDLLRPVEFLGSSRPAIEFLPLSMSLILQHRGELAVYLRAAQEAVGEAKPAESGRGELTDKELAAAVGGTGNFQTITVTMPTPQQVAQQQAQIFNLTHPNTSTSLGGLLQSGSPGSVILGVTLGISAGEVAAAAATIGILSLSVALEIGTFAFL